MTPLQQTLHKAEGERKATKFKLDNLDKKIRFLKEEILKEEDKERGNGCNSRNT